MDRITLRITNVDRLVDGGPLSYSSLGKRFEIGRESHLDWSLPDAQLFISGRHCEIVPDRAGYVLHDVSRNGTFVNGSHQRVKSPYVLRSGDTLAIGNYIVSVDIVAEQPTGDVWGHGADSAGIHDDDDIWGNGPSASPPMAKDAFRQPYQQPANMPDFVESHLDIPVPKRAEPPLRRPDPRPREQPISVQRRDVFAENPMPAAGVTAGIGQEASGPAGFPRQKHGGELLAAFKEGAKLPAHALTNRDPAETFREVGATMLMISEQVAQLLRARASAKAMVRTSNRTMIGAQDNNPLKFLPDSSEALEAMLSRERMGFLDGPRAFREAFDDLKTHELATYAAMQRALARLLEDLSPEVVESKVSQSSFTNKKAKAWEIFVSRWEAKTESHANGMLDVFLKYFSEAYEQISSKRT